MSRDAALPSDRPNDDARLSYAPDASLPPAPPVADASPPPAPPALDTSPIPVPLIGEERPQPTINSRTRLCALCGRPLRAGQHLLRVHGSTIHARCSSIER